MAMRTLEELLEENKLDLKTMIVFRKAERTIRSIEQRVIKENKLTPTQFSVLETLYSKGKMRIQDLIDHMLATSGNMTVVIKNMVRDGLISRTSDPNDRRSYLIELSQKGQELIEEIFPQHILCVKDALAILSDEDKETLISILKKYKNCGDLRTKSSSKVNRAFNRRIISWRLIFFLNAHVKVSQVY